MTIETVGSFLPPEKLTKAGNDFSQGIIDRQHFASVENESIAQLVERQLASGLTEVTDGEFRRHAWDKDFWFGLEGISRERVDSGRIYQAIDPFTDLMRFTRRIAYNPEHPFFNDYTFLQKTVNDRASCRQVIPSPANLYLEILTMSDGHSEQIYPNAASLPADIAKAYKKTIRHLYDLGCRHVQLDDTACGRLIEDNFAKCLLQGGIDLISLHNAIVDLLNSSIADLPSDMELSLYLSGGDNIVPEWEFLQFPDNLMPKILSQVNVGKFYMPFDMSNCYQFEILRYVPTGKKVVLGLADAHSPLSEDIPMIHAAIAMASTHIPVDNLSISPKTGFKLSSYASRGLTYEDQWYKISQLQNINVMSEAV